MMMDHYLILPTFLCLKFSLMILDIHLLTQERNKDSSLGVTSRGLGWAGLGQGQS